MSSLDTAHNFIYSTDKTNNYAGLWWVDISHYHCCYIKPSTGLKQRYWESDYLATNQTSKIRSLPSQAVPKTVSPHCSIQISVNCWSPKSHADMVRWCSPETLVNREGLLSNTHSGYPAGIHMCTCQMTSHFTCVFMLKHTILSKYLLTVEILDCSDKIKVPIR